MAAIIPAVVIGTAVGNELPRFFNDALEQFGSGEGVYLRDGEPEGIVAKIGQAVGRAYCRGYDSVSDQYTPERALRIERACRPYLDSIGSPGGPGLELQFRGGQCDNSTYGVTVNYEWTEDDGAVTEGSTIARRVRGPFQGVTIRGSEGSVNRPVVRFCARAVADSNFVNPPAGTSGVTVCREFTQSIGDADIGSHRITNVAVVLFSGTDDCGNPVPIPTRPPLPTNPTPPPFRFNPSPDIDIDIDVELFPDGSITFDIGTGPITVNPLDDAPPGGGGGGGAAGGDGLPGSPDAGATPAFSGVPSPGGEDVDFGPPPDGSVWVGCLARVQAGAVVGSIAGSELFNPAYPRAVGNLSLRYGSGRGEAVAVRSEWTERFRPVTALEVTGAFVNALPGSVVTIFPVSATICPEDICGGGDG